MTRTPHDAATRWTVAELLDWTERFFRDRRIATPRLDAELLLASVLGGGRLGLYTAYHKPVEPHERERFRELVKERGRRRPVAYLLGHREFYSLRFQVSPAVLIPRPETEHVVDEALAFLRGPGATIERPRALDLGTGSGNIAVSLAVTHPSLEVWATDISSDALAVARANALEQGIADRVRFLEGDLFEALPAGAASFDLIVSNPPYVRRDDVEDLMEDVRLYEPRTALLDVKSPDGDGLGFYRSIARSAPDHLAPRGAAIVEVGDGQGQAVAAIFARAGLSSVECVRDYSRIERVVRAARA